MNQGDVLFFDGATDLRTWLDANHSTTTEVWLGYWKKASGRRGISYVESVDEALCYGWIDGLTRGVDEARYSIRFTPRRARSNWSEANVRRVAELAAAGRMTAAGMKQFEARREPEPGTYTYETRPPDLPQPYANIFGRNESAWRFYTAQRASYRRSMTWWVVSARREETRLRRLDALIAESAAGHVIDELRLPKLGAGRRDV